MAPHRSRVTFASGTDIDIAQMDVQNRLRAVEQRLPEEVRRQGILVNQASSSFLMIIALTSKSGETAIARARQLRNDARHRRVASRRRRRRHPVVLVRIRDARVARSRPARDLSACRRPTRCGACRNRTRSRPAVSSGIGRSRRRGAQRADPDAESLHDAGAVRVDHPARQSRRLGRAARRCRARRARRAELPSDMELNGKPAAGMAVQLATGANALSTAEGVKQRMARARANFPAGHRLGGALRHDAVHSHFDRGSGARRWSRRWRWCSSSCFCFCRTGARH